jgi:hypothetical protein
VQASASPKGLLLRAWESSADRDELKTRATKRRRITSNRSHFQD